MRSRVKAREAVWRGTPRSGRVVENGGPCRLCGDVPVAPSPARPFEMPLHGRFGTGPVSLCYVVEQLEMLARGLLEKVSRRVVAGKAVQTYAVSQRLDQLGKRAIAERGNQLNVEFEIRIEKGDQIAGLSGLPRGLGQLMELVELLLRQSILGD